MFSCFSVCFNVKHFCHCFLYYFHMLLVWHRFHHKHRVIVSVILEWRFFGATLVLQEVGESPCYWCVAGSNPSSICLSHCDLGQDTSSTLPAGCGQRVCWCRCMAASPLGQGSCGDNVAYHHQCWNVWMTVVWSTLESMDLIKYCIHLIYYNFHK